jgi:DNA-binding MarR family transcriptional regulator
MSGSSAVRVSEDLVGSLRTAVMSLARRIRQQGEFGITPSQLAILGDLNKQGTLTLGELAAIERVQPPSITRTVDSLEERELVERETMAGDRRVTRVRLTARGRRLIQSIRLRRNAWLAARLRELTDDELADLSRAVHAINRILDDQDQ